MNTQRIEFKWTTSKGFNTYGWNICSTYMDGKKQNQNCGGGYDMKGTALADYIQDNYQDRLLKIHKRIRGAYSVRRIYTPKIAKENNWAGGKYRRLKERKNSLYGGTAYYYRGQRKPFKISLDGGCGFNSIDVICKAIGLRLHYTGEKTSSTFYILEDTRA
tara:strand:+ start:896 stop:1378 length:483 start_codon:yes stop_codon:yes gene_type:complete